MPYSERDRHFYVKLDNGSTFSLGNFKALMSNTLNKIPVDKTWSPMGSSKSHYGSWL